jgi:hypothetical protein
MATVLVLPNGSYPKTDEIHYHIPYDTASSPTISAPLDLSHRHKQHISMTAWSNVSFQLSLCFPEHPGRHPDLVLRKIGIRYDLALGASSYILPVWRSERAGEHIHTGNPVGPTSCGLKATCGRGLCSSTWSSKVRSDPDVSSRLDLGDPYYSCTAVRLLD